MKLDGIHHITAITGDAPRNVDFYTGVLGLRLVKKTVNQDDPTVYHLFYADEEGSAGADITFFEYPGAAPGRAGAGMVHRSSGASRSAEALDFWAERLARRGRRRRADGGGCASPTPRGSATSSSSTTCRDAPLRRRPPRDPAPSTRCRASTACAPTRDARSAAARSSRRRSASSARTAARGRCAATRAAATIAYDPPPGEPGVARAPAPSTTSPGPRRWPSTRPGSERVAEAGASADAGDRPLLLPLDLLPRAERRPLRDRDDRPGFTVDEDAEHLGEALILPPAFEHLREQIEPVLTPLPNPRAAAARA